MSRGVCSIGMDVGSTTVKTVVLDERERLLWSAYDRHETRQAEALLRQLSKAQAVVEARRCTVFVTGSGCNPLVEVLGATFVQEVNAIEHAAQSLYPDTGSVVEFGGQDAKIIIWKSNVAGEKRSIVTMNDKCAGGTGATLDRILCKVGVTPEEAAAIPWDPRKLHRIAAKCGVFAETDVVELLKNGISRDEIVLSILHSITQQNLEVLTRSNLLRPRVLLLGGPNFFFPEIVECWRYQIARHWEERRFSPGDRQGDLREAVLCPPNAQYFAALGAVLAGTSDRVHDEQLGSRREDRTVSRLPLESLERFIAVDRAAVLSKSGRSRPPLVRDEEEKRAFLARYTPAPIVPARLEPGSTARVYLGIDGGSTSTKAVLLSESLEVLVSSYVLSSGNPLEDMKLIFGEFDRWASSQGAEIEVIGAGSTGYARRLLKETLHLDTAVVETVAHMLSAQALYDDIDVICDVGGQDIKIIFLKDGRIKDYRFNTQCCAGNGYFLQSMAAQFNVPLDQFAEHAFRARITPQFHYGCVVFMEQDKVHLQQLGWSPEEMLAGLAQVLPLNIWQYIALEPNIAKFGRRFLLQGGTQRNLAAVKAQVDYIVDRVPGAEVYVHRYASEAGAIGAAFEARRATQATSSSSFIGISEALGIEYRSRNDQSTRCSFCSNHCARTFISTKTATGRESLFISGYACDKGSSLDTAELKSAEREKKKAMESAVNLVDRAAQTLFADYDVTAPRPTVRSSLGRALTWSASRLLNRAAGARGGREGRFDHLRVGIPRALTLYHSAPFFSTFFKALGVKDVVFSDFTSPRLWEAGSRWGTIDPCFPAKVANAHVHDLLYGKKVNAIFFPMIECFESHLTGVRGSTACTIETATPEVVEATFTKEENYFEKAGVQYWKPLVNLQRPRECASSLQAYLGPRLGVSRGEVDRAVELGFAALAQYSARLRAWGREVIDAAVEQGNVVVVSIGRSYHSDPGINHGILTKFQLRGYPTIPIEAIPYDEEFVERLFADEQGRVDPEEAWGVLDVWKRAYNYGQNSKLWAAKVVSRHPNMVGLSLSCFKCGYDYSISGYLENIASAAQSPYFTLHDLDQKKSDAALDLRVESMCYFLSNIRDSLSEAARRPGRSVR